METNRSLEFGDVIRASSRLVAGIDKIIRGVEVTHDEISEPLEVLSGSEVVAATSGISYLVSQLDELLGGEGELSSWPPHLAPHELQAILAAARAIEYFGVACARGIRPAPEPGRFIPLLNSVLTHGN